MRWNALFITGWCLVGSAPLLGQARETIPTPTDTTAPNIPGVVAGGTKVQVLQTWDRGFGGEGPIGMPDGSLLFTQQDLVRVDRNGNSSTIRPRNVAFAGPDRKTLCIITPGVADTSRHARWRER